MKGKRFLVFLGLSLLLLAACSTINQKGKRDSGQGGSNFGRG